MPSISVIGDLRQSVEVRLDESRLFTAASVKSLFAEKNGVDEKDFYLTNNGRSVGGDDLLTDGDVLRVHVRLCGGKGGFGSMLRALGAQIEKTTNHEAMRDLSGRRVRDVNNEKALTSWLSKTAERQRQREERRRERIARKKRQLEEGPRHKFTDVNYDIQRNKVLDNLDDAVEAGLKSLKEKSSDSGSGSGAEAAAVVAARNSRKKRKSEDEKEGSSAGKKLFGMEDLDEGDGLSSSSSMSSGEEDEEAEKADLEELKRMREELKVNLAGLDMEEKEREEEEEMEEVEEEEEDGEIVDGTKPVKRRKKVKEQITVESESPASKNADTTASLPPANGAASSTSSDVVSSIPPADDSASPNPPTAVDNAVVEEAPAPPSPKPLPPLPLNLEDYSSTEELAEFGLDFLKAALTEIGVKCGGTLEERAARIWSVKGKPREEWDKSLFAKGKGKGKSNKN